MRETEVSSATRNPAGKRKSQGRETTAGVPSCSRVPSDTSGGWMPRPKYDSEVSAMIAPHTPIVASTIRSEDTFRSEERRVGKEGRTASRPQERTTNSERTHE